MLRRIVLSVLVAIVVTLGCILLGIILSAIGVSIAVAVGGFIRQYAAAIGIVAGLWYFFKGTWGTA